MTNKNTDEPTPFNLSDLDERLAKTDHFLDLARTYLIKNGTVLDLTEEWLTISDYCARFKIKNTQTVSNWIKRGIISSQDIHNIPELNNTRFIRAKKFHEE
jgi:hypothetical protein